MSIFNESSISAMVFLRETKAWNEWEKLLGGKYLVILDGILDGGISVNS